ncbi:MAG: hypothetical protein ABI347_06330 [Nitrososphaera sp.]|jgi:hypothetical protein
MKQWHTEHMQKTVIKYVKGISENASAWEKRNHKKYCGLTNVCRQIEYDIKHGATEDDVAAILYKVRHDSSFLEIHDSKGESKSRLTEIEVHFRKSNHRRGIRSSGFGLV